MRRQRPYRRSPRARSSGCCSARAKRSSHRCRDKRCSVSTKRGRVARSPARRRQACCLSSRPTASSSVSGVAGHAGGAEAAERRPRGRPSTAGSTNSGHVSSRIRSPPLSDTGSETAGGGAAALLLAGFDRLASAGRIEVPMACSRSPCALPAQREALASFDEMLVGAQRRSSREGVITDVPVSSWRPGAVDRPGGPSGPLSTARARSAVAQSSVRPAIAAGPVRGSVVCRSSRIAP